MGDNIVSAAFFSATSSGTNMYIANNTSTSTTNTATGTWPNADDSVWLRHGPPQRIMQRQPLPARAVVPKDRLIGHYDCDKDIMDAHLEMHDIKILEIPYHRIYRGMKHFEVPENTLLELPDGTFIDVEDAHHYTIHDARTQVVREECTIRAFNRFLNASELLEAFIRDMAPAGIRQDQVLKVPIEGFINWLIYKAAEADGDPLPDNGYNHRCIYCQRFIPRRHVVRGINFCNANHLDRYLSKVQLLEAPA